MFSHCSCSLSFLYLYIFRCFESRCLVPDSNPKRSRAEKTGRESSADSLELYRFFNRDVVLVSMAQMEGMGRTKDGAAAIPTQPVVVVLYFRDLMEQAELKHNSLQSLAMRITAFRDTSALAVIACSQFLTF